MNDQDAYRLILASEMNDFELGKMLFKEYAESKGFDLSYQNFEQELIKINTQYNQPSGGLILIKKGEMAVGCGGIRQFGESVAELKRMYIQPEHRGKGLGKQLLNKLIDLARKLQYERIWLDTLESLETATHLYRSSGFTEMEAYRFNPHTDVLYFEYNLTTTGSQSPDRLK